MRTSNRFRPSVFFKNAHVQTLLGSSKLRTFGHNAMRAVAREKIIQTAEDVRLLGYHSFQNNHQAKGLVILLHGWEGSVDSTYILCCGRRLFRCGYDIFRLNFRDHGDSHHLNKGIFYAVLLEEIYQAVNQAAGFSQEGPVFLIGFSLGANFVLRILKRWASAPIANLHHAVCISPVLDPEKSTAKIDQIAFIRKYFLAKWRRSLTKKQGLFPDLYDFEEILQLKTIQAVTDALLEKYSDFQSARDYFQAYSVVDAALKDLVTPTTIITAEDDPIIPIADFYNLKLNAHIRLVVHSHGGHNGFINGFNLKSWYEDKIIEIFDQVAQNQNR
jgi:predicted alpha/beta-fold hydrolase